MSNKGEHRTSGFSCEKRAADPQNESATCVKWCGDSQRCVTGFDTAKFFRHIDMILSMDMEQREQSTFGAREATPELLAAIRAVNGIEEKTRRSMFGALSEHKQCTKAPEVSSELIQELAKMCGLIPSHTTAEWVSTLVRFVRVVLDNNSVQEAFVRANAGLLSVSSATTTVDPVEGNPTNNYLFKQLCAKHGIELGKDTIAEALAKIAAPAVLTNEQIDVIWSDTRETLPQPVSEAFTMRAFARALLAAQPARTVKLATKPHTQD